ncbi:MAG: hypothetical protein HY054_15365 [Proteobacteria bacterium]|nr:hypothetical protein [Pseudomonadota bacterium]
MLKPLSAFAALATFAVAAALAEPQVTPSPAAQAQQQTPQSVDTMTCDQMASEMMGAGQRMNSQLDPQFGVEANAMQQDAQQKQREAMQQVTNPACYIPFLGMACAAQQQQQQQQAQADAPRQQARMQAQMNRLNNSMAGIDQSRMQAMSARFQQMNCQAQMQQSGQAPH